MKRLFAMFMALALTALVPLSAQASGGHDLNGAELSILWVVPFVCMLAVHRHRPPCRAAFLASPFRQGGPLLGPRLPRALRHGLRLQLAVYQFVHVLFMEYVPFIILLFALFTIAGASASKVSSWARLW